MSKTILTALKYRFHDFQFLNYSIEMKLSLDYLKCIIKYKYYYSIKMMWKPPIPNPIKSFGVSFTYFFKDTRIQPLFSVCCYFANQKIKITKVVFH